MTSLLHLGKKRRRMRRKVCSLWACLAWEWAWAWAREWAQAWAWAWASAGAWACAGAWCAAGVDAVPGGRTWGSASDADSSNILLETDGYLDFFFTQRRPSLTVVGVYLKGKNVGFWEAATAGVQSTVRRQKAWSPGYFLQCSFFKTMSSERNFC